MAQNARTLRDIGGLIDAGLIDPAQRHALEPVTARYAVALTPHLAGLINASDPHDPIARQFVPDPAELQHDPADLADPIGDGAHSPCEGIVHRYPDRVLLKLVSVCAVYCRFCFRREMVGPNNAAGEAAVLAKRAYDRALDYIRANPAIWEVILTGGDPLVLSARRLTQVLADLAAISHVGVIRIHSRLPIADPAMMDEAMVTALASASTPVWLALHVNHPHELSGATRALIARLIQAGVPLVSQTVLLRGINDDADTLERLMRDLVACRVKPYYLHHGDRAPGTAHLRLSIAQGQAIVAALRSRLSGLAMPSYVLDIPGGFGKVPLMPGHVDREDGRLRIRDGQGALHDYEGDGA